MNRLNSTKIKRCTSATLPHFLPLGVPVLCTDTGSLYVGMGEENKLVLVRDMKTLELLINEIDKLKQNELENLQSSINELDSKYRLQLDLVDRRLTNIEQSGGVSVIRETVTPYRYVESLVGNGQKAYTLNHVYEVGLERLEVFVGGIFQKSGRDYTETNASTITFNENIPTGVVIDVVIYTKSVTLLNHEHAQYLGRREKAVDSSKLDNFSQDYKATPNTIVRRDGYGDIYTRSGLVIQDPEQGNLGVYGTNVSSNGTVTPKFKDMKNNVNSTIWCDQNLVVEKGTWIPSIYGANHGVMVTDTAQGVYRRVGNIAHVSGRVKVNTGRQGATGELRIGGLPFVNRGAMTPCSIGFYRGIELGNYQVGAYVDVPSGGFIRFTHSDPKSDDVGWGYVDCGSHMNGTYIDIAFSVTLNLE